MKIIGLVLILLLVTIPTLATEIVGGKAGNVPIATVPVIHKTHNIKDKFTKIPATTFHLIGKDLEPGIHRTMKWLSPQSPGGFTLTQHSVQTL